MNSSRTDTIVAVSSPHGSAWRGILRLSGPEAMRAVSAQLRDTVDLSTVAASSSLRANLKMDEAGRAMPVWVYVMHSPHSYTGEEMIEIHTIGNSAVLETMLQRMCRHPGVRPAGPGEFTLKAFLNGKRDLMRAEAVMEIIQSQDTQDLTAIQAQAAGPLSSRMSEVEDRLLDLCAEVEAAIDFTDQDIEIISSHTVQSRLAQIDGRLDEVLSHSRLRSVAGDRVRILLTGAPNVGKSTLFNRLVPEGKVIVSDVAGTTRDVIEGHLDLESVPCALFDSAGILENPGGIDAEAVRRTRDVIGTMDLVLVMIDATRPEAPDPLPTVEHIVVINKCDRAQSAEVRQRDAVRISAQTGEGLDALRARILEKIRQHGGQQGGAHFRLNQRQLHALQHARAAIAKALDAARSERGLELVAFDLRDALGHMGSLTGRSVTDDILQRIFDRFCIGK